MRDYAELVKALRYCGSPVTNEYNCNNCPWLSKCKDGTGENPLLKSADAIEELSRNLKDCRNELCLQCGAYKQRHMGVCDGCRWLDEPSKEETE